MFRDVIIALSLANMCLLPLWEKLGYLDSSNSYFTKTLPTTNSFTAFIIIFLLCATIFWLGIGLVRHFNNPLLRKAGEIFFGFLVFVFYSLTLTELIKVLWLEIILYSLIITLAVILLIKRNFIKIAVKGVLIIAPLAIIVLTQASWSIISHKGELNRAAGVNSFLQIREENSTQRAVKPRVVWLIFDEMGQATTFNNKINNKKLSAFNRLRQQAIFAENAVAPMGRTILAIPSLFTGRRVLSAEVKGPNDMMIIFQGTRKKVSWRSQTSIFSQAKDLKLNTALVGWYHPYSRIYADQIAFCSWDAWSHKYYDINYPKDTLKANITAQIFSLIKPGYSKAHHIKIYLNALENSLRAVSNPEFDLIVIHLPIPHSPYIFDESQDRVSFYGKSSYSGNLVLADRTLSKIRKTMEEKGIWNQTTVLVSADHSEQIGTSDLVPFMIKFADQSRTINYHQTFNITLTKDLIIAILEKKIKTETELVKWLEQQDH